MKPAAGSAESKVRLLQEPAPLKSGGKRGSRCNYRTHKVALTITLAIVSSALVGTVLAVLLFTRSLDLVSCAVPSPGSHAVPYCPEGWVGYGGKCYYFSEEAKNWDSSQHFCSLFNASLAGIDTQQEKPDSPLRPDVLIIYLAGELAFFGKFDTPDGAVQHLLNHLFYLFLDPQLLLLQREGSKMVH